MMRRRAAGLVGLLAAVAVVAGCSSSEQPAVERAVADFGAAVAGGDLGAACGLLAPATRSTVEFSESQPCPQALTQAALPTGRVLETSVWGGTAQVRTSADTLFLTRTGQGWRIAAAGCTPQGEAPYQCRVEGP
jgi:hypothetical protein